MPSWDWLLHGGRGRPQDWRQGREPRKSWEDGAGTSYHSGEQEGPPGGEEEEGPPVYCTPTTVKLTTKSNLQVAICSNLNHQRMVVARLRLNSGLTIYFQGPLALFQALN